MKQFATDQNDEALESVDFENQQLAQVTQDFFDSMLGFKLSDETETAQSQDWFGDSSWGASIRISGEWSAEVNVLMTNKLAERIACEMFCMEPDVLQEEEVLDAVGEVVNIIGGNAKGVVNRESSLSLPCVGKFDELPNKPDYCVLFDCEGENLWVSVSQK